MNLLLEPLKVFALEYSDGIIYCHDLVLHIFIRMTFVCAMPLTVCFTLVYLLVYENHSFVIYVTLLATFLLVNQVWISLFIVLTIVYPPGASRICAVMAAIGGYFCGFIIPKPVMPEAYRWIFYVNPSYYAYAATSVTVLTNTDQLDCSRESKLECFSTSAVAVLASFGLGDVNPYMSIVVLLGMAAMFLAIAVLVLWVKMQKLSVLFSPVVAWYRKTVKRK